VVRLRSDDAAFSDYLSLYTFERYENCSARVGLHGGGVNRGGGGAFGGLSVFLEVAAGGAQSDVDQRMRARGGGGATRDEERRRVHCTFVVCMGWPTS